jgi:chromosome partitioning protein
MKIWAVMTQKGGAGKSTIALHLAIAAHGRGLKTAVIDVDPQRSAMKWAVIRGRDAPLISSGVVPELPRMLSRMEGDRTDLVVIDTSPRADRDLVVIAGLADLIILPVRPSILDIPAVADTMKLIKAAGRSDRAVLVLNAVAPRTDEGDEAAAILGGMGTVLTQRLGDRVDLRRALTAGHGVTEFLPRSKAAEEIRALYEALDSIQIAEI